MTEQDFQRFAAVWAGALTVYGREVTAPALRAVFSVLQEYTVEQVNAALNAHMADPDAGRFPPMPAHVVAKIRPTDADASALAWARVSAAIRHVGRMASPDFGCQRIHAAINQMGGWPRLCGLSEDALPFAAKEFAAYWRNADGLPAPTPTGLENASRAEFGQQSLPHRLVGPDGKPEPMPVVVAERQLPAPTSDVERVTDPKAALRAVMQVFQGGQA